MPKTDPEQHLIETIEAVLRVKHHDAMRLAGAIAGLHPAKRQLRNAGYAGPIDEPGPTDTKAPTGDEQ